MEGFMDLNDFIAKIPQRHLIWYLLLMGALPFLAVAIFFSSELEQVDNLELYIEDVQHLAERVEKKQAANIATRSKYRGADHFYIDKNLETLKFLQPELEGLQKVTENPNFIEDDWTRKRMAFLSGKQNRLSFSESNVQSTPFYKEVTESLLHPVEVNSSDVQKILALVEGRQIGAFKNAPQMPQLLILDFKLEKKNLREKNEVFDLNMKLLKREFP